MQNPTRVLATMGQRYEQRQYGRNEEFVMSLADAQDAEAIHMVQILGPVEQKPAVSTQIKSVDSTSVTTRAVGITAAVIDEIETEEDEVAAPASTPTPSAQQHQPNRGPQRPYNHRAMHSRK